METGLRGDKAFKFLSQFENIEDFKTSYRLVDRFSFCSYEFDETFKSADDVL